MKLPSSVSPPQAAGTEPDAARTDGTPVDETQTVPMQPDWNTNSDQEFVQSAKAVFLQHAEVLRRLACSAI